MDTENTKRKKEKRKTTTLLVREGAKGQMKRLTLERRQGGRK